MTLSPEPDRAAMALHFLASTGVLPCRSLLVGDPAVMEAMSHNSLNPVHVPFWQVNNPALWDYCVSLIGRAHIDGSKSEIAKYPCDNYSDTSS